jgi:hypothetical protein
MDRLAKNCLILIAFVLTPAVAFAQASIVGTVRDASGAVLPGVTVEASSPVLIEKTRSVVTNGVGQYAIEDLRPGTYTVSFTIQGFVPVRREGIALAGTFIANVSQDLKVGGITDAITVSGEPPIVDVSSVRSQQVISGETVTELPTSRQYSALTQLVPAINVQNNDFQGSNPALYSVFQIHGGRRNEGQVLLDGMNAGYQGMGVSGHLPSIGNAEEVVFSLSGGLADATTGGPQMNIVGKQGGNRFAGSYFMSGTGSAFQTTNLKPGITASNSIQKLWDVNPSFGGPIVVGKLWFYGTYRYQISRQNVASMWVNKNAGDPTKWNYDPDLTKQAVDDGTWKNTTARVTWQITPRNKLGVWNGLQYHCQHCEGGGDGTGLGFGASIRSPESQLTDENRPSLLTQVSWTSPVTNRLLLEANAQLGPYFWWGQRQKNAYDATTIPVTENGGLVPGITYRAGGGGNQGSAGWTDHRAFTNIVQGSASYITGSHSTKFGFRYHHNDAYYPINFYNNTQLSYIFQDGVPASLIAYADANSNQQQQQSMIALYAQDRWTMGRLSLQGGLRFEHLGDHFPQQQMGPNLFLPTPVVFPDQAGPLAQKDLMPRFGAAYDLFGNGRTAVKFFLGRYVTTFNTVDEWLNYSPAGFSQFVATDNRGWTDNGDFIANCNFRDPNPNGECGPGNPFFGKQVSPFTVDPDTTRGWNTREYSWDLTASVVHEILPRVSVELSYIRRTWGNLATTVNRAVTPADFDAFTYAVPQDPKLPNGGGYNLTFYDIKPAKFGQLDNYRTFADKVGGATDKFNGVDFTVNARLRNVTLQGGFSTGNRVEDDCGVAQAHPETYIFPFWGGTSAFFTESPFVGGFSQWPQAFCHRESTWLTNVKGLASYTVPRIDVLVSGTFRTLPTAGNEFPSVATQSLTGQAVALQIPGVVTQTSLARGFGSGQPFMILNIVHPGELYGERLKSVDLRLGKILRYAGTKAQVSLDVFNLFNSNTTEKYQLNYGTTYLNPLQITAARFFKISAQLDF